MSIDLNQALEYAVAWAKEVLCGGSQFDVIYRILFVHIRRDLYTEEFLLSLIR